MHILEQKKSECDNPELKYVSVAHCRVLENELHPAEQWLSFVMCHSPVY